MYSISLIYQKHIAMWPKNKPLKQQIKRTSAVSYELYYMFCSLKFCLCTALQVSTGCTHFLDMSH